jgi:hypothetical protein
MPIHTPKERAKRSRKISLLRSEGKPQKQAVAIALSPTKKPKKKNI